MTKTILHVNYVFVLLALLFFWSNNDFVLVIVRLCSHHLFLFFFLSYYWAQRAEEIYKKYYLVCKLHYIVFLHCEHTCKAGKCLIFSVNFSVKWSNHQPLCLLFLRGSQRMREWEWLRQECLHTNKLLKAVLKLALWDNLALLTRGISICQKQRRLCS